MEHESLWAEIDYAERCLVSALYDNALTSATSTLCILCREVEGVVHTCSQGGDGTNDDACQHHDMINMIEAAGMVLVQALSQMGRASDIFHELVSIFGSVANVPFILVFNGSCLELSKGFSPSSAKILEEYLSAWSYPEKDANKTYMVKLPRIPEATKNDNHFEESSSTFESMSQFFALSRTGYLNLVEVYTIDVLGRSYRDSRAAYLWVQNSKLSKEDKAITLNKLRLAFQSERRSSSSTSESNAKGVSEVVTRTSDIAQEPKQEIQALTTGDTRQSTRTLTSEGSQPDSVVNDKVVRRLPIITSMLKVIELILMRLGWISKRAPGAANLPSNKVILTRAATILLVSALLRKRQNVARWILQAGSLARIYCMDLWQLAFSMHLNPLAAV